MNGDPSCIALLDFIYVLCSAKSLSKSHSLSYISRPSIAKTTSLHEHLETPRLQEPSQEGGKFVTQAQLNNQVTPQRADQIRSLT